MVSQNRQLRRVQCIYNTDYDEELKAETGADVSAVQEAARAVCQGIADFGFETELVGVEGPDIDRVIAKLKGDPPDLVFNLCESMSGDVRNEVVLPSLLDMLEIPYTGPGPLTILMCLHKDRTKDVLHQAKINTPDHRVLATPADLEDPSLAELDYPFFLKLAHEDASIGIEAANVVADRAALVARAEAMLDKFKQPLICEQFIEGREVNVTVMDTEDGLITLPLHEISFADMPDDRPKIVSYAAKWDENHVDYEGTKPVPMKGVSPQLEKAIVDISVDTFRALDLHDFGRVDLRIDSSGVPWVIDVNPNCDLSPDAGVARAARHAGLTFPELVGRVCQSAWRRKRRAAASS
ncbi:MAG: D-alanine--D-alanine ligase [Deltaproteobacteria bacterium]|nr:D-alanine--D-alanine ligase [Deltaproteobacteria bacterium]